MNDVSYHVPVLKDAVISFLFHNKSGVYVDGTLGGGGYVPDILSKLTAKGLIVGIDRDVDSVEYCMKRFNGESRVKVIHGNFGQIDRLLKNEGIFEIDGLLLDLGISSHQIDSASRGFSYMSDSPLDMRMNREDSLRSEDIINNYEESDLADILYIYGEERGSRRIAKNIVAARRKQRIITSNELAEIVRRSVPGRYQIKTLSRIWQALRIEVNQELDDLIQGLHLIYPILSENARVVVISYESLSDRIVKRYLKGYEPAYRKDMEYESEKLYKFKILTKKVIKPDFDEIRNNRRARTAKLRAAEKINA